LKKMTKSMNFPTVFIDACSTYFSKCNDDYEILIFMTNQRKKKQQEIMYMQIKQQQQQQRNGFKFIMNLTVSA
jgi:hypothetical protein